MRKYLIIILFSCITNSIFGQDTIFLNNSYEKIESFKKAIFYKIIEQKNEKELTETLYYKSGKVKSEFNYIFNKRNKKINHGKHRFWDEDGEKRIEINYYKGKKNGELFSFWKNGEFKRKDYFKNGKLKKGTCWNENGLEVKYYDFEIEATFPRGKYELSKYLREKIKIDYSRGMTINWNVKVKFYVDEKGKPSKPILLVKSRNLKTDILIVETILNMPKWNPALQDNIPIGTWVVFPIKLRH